MYHNYYKELEPLFKISGTPSLTDLQPFYNGVGADTGIELGDGNLEGRLLADLSEKGTLPYLTFVEARLAELKDYFRKLNSRYNKKMAILAKMVADVFSDFAPEIAKKTGSGKDGKGKKFYVVAFFEPGSELFSDIKDSIFDGFVVSDNVKNAASKGANQARVVSVIKDLVGKIFPGRSGLDGFGRNFIVHVYEKDKVTLAKGAFYKEKGTDKIVPKNFSFKL